MIKDYLTAEVAFDRAIVESLGGETLIQFSQILFDLAPTWASNMIAWSPNPRERREVGDGGASLNSLVEQQTRWAKEDRHTGTVELRGATGDLNVVISVNSSPLARVGGKLLMTNGISVTALRKKIEGVSRPDWMRSIFDNICDMTDPVWGALYSESEYRAKVMAEEPSLRAVGRDFSRYLPGLFPVNYYGVKYVDLIGEQKFKQIRSATARKVGSGWTVEVIADPFSWETADSVSKNMEVLTEIGPDFFFLMGREKVESRAPDWTE